MSDIDSAATPQEIQSSAPSTVNKKPVCRFFNSKHGCRAGDKCRFQHVSSSPVSKGSTDTISQPVAAEPSTPKGTNTPAMTAPRNPVARPVPKAQTDDPRTFQLAQIQRRYKPESLDDNKGNTVLQFDMQPSDPDFPYEIESLQCVLSVPQAYPNQEKLTLLVKNGDIPRGFQINIERGFDDIVAENPNATLLNLMNRLDRQLETILSGKKVETIKIVANRDTSKIPVSEKTASRSESQPEETSANVQDSYTDDELKAAQKIRQSHIRQLEARFSRMQTFTKASDGVTYTIPLDSPKRSSWPTALQSVRTFRMVIPHKYPLEPAEAHFGVESPETFAIEGAFKRRATEDPGATLTQRINYLSQNLKEMSVTEPHHQKPAPLARPVESPSTITAAASTPVPAEANAHDTHLHYIPRPPEWDLLRDADESDDDSHSDTAGEDGDDTAESDEPTEATGSSAPAERGILLSFPQLELHAIELLELVSLNITVKCERCKDTMDVSRLRSSAENSEMRVESCKKCAAGLGFRFRADMIHANAVRAGYLDLDGCTIVDMLPSNFIPTCAECSTSIPAPGVVAVRGDSAFAVCRECHKKLTFRIIEVKFLHVSASAARASLAPGRRKAKENLGITAGTELPQCGRCSHYKKSYRWFRFSCCNKVFACDRCHDGKEDHPNEWANRMLCGYCSREQNFRPEDCGICHASLTGKRGTGFWEGGKGTRDPRKMSRKDPRKYKRAPGSKK